eukprot:320136-Rhodomonas_salina.2
MDFNVLLVEELLVLEERLHALPQCSLCLQHLLLQFNPLYVFEDLAVLDSADGRAEAAVTPQAACTPPALSRDQALSTKPSLKRKRELSGRAHHRAPTESRQTRNLLAGAFRFSHSPTQAGVYKE